ncbi:MAG: Outer membrane protein assembly factor BamB [Phycisphaerae bacterium]|nr:Outer membrane protein assembly factor BamB [Phycisphaerae bacterium]
MPKVSSLVGVVLIALGACASARGGDFNQWRGPQRNGLAPGGPQLDVRWDKSGPPLLWQSEEIPGSLESGSGCVSVAAGRAYLYVQWKYQQVLATRTVSRLALERLGWTSREIPPDLLKAMEEARTCPELEKLEGQPRVDWIKKWADEHVTTAPEKKAIYSFAVRRLTQGKDAVPMEFLAKLATIQNKEFPSQAALDAWFADNHIPAAQKALVVPLIPTAVGKSWDTLVCLNVADGKVIFKKQFEGAGPYGSYPYGASSTPTVVDGRCYFTGSKNDVYCLDAVSGEEIWQINPQARGRGINHSSPAVADGKVFVAAGELIALDQAKGTVVWRQPAVRSFENSPVPWRSGDKMFLLCNTGQRLATVYCVDSADGHVVWTVPGGSRSTVAVVGDHMVTSVGPSYGDSSRFGLAAYKLSTDKPEKLWANTDFHGLDASPVIYNGYVYAIGETAICIELATGKVAWEQKTRTGGEISPVVADGKMFTTGGGMAMAFRATHEKCDLLASARMPVCKYIAVTIADGRLYLRQPKNVACYDLTRPTATTQPD